MRFNPPPGWPAPPAGWAPGPGWKPDPSWPAAPPDWEFWVPQEQVAPGRTGQVHVSSGSTAATDRRRRNAKLLGWGAVALTGLIGAASSGLSGAALMLGLFAAVVAVIVLVRGSVGWAGLRTRAAGGTALAAAVVALVVGAATAPPTAPVVDVTSPRSPQTTTPPSSSPTMTTPSRSAQHTTATVTPPTTGHPAAPTVTGAPPGSAAAAVAVLVVKGRAPMTGYDRSAFGPAWADFDANGCDQRNDVLRRDLSSKTLKGGTHGCVVMTGVLHDPYTGQTVSFRRTTGSSSVQIDHVVPEANAWVTGAQSWTAAKRTQFATDPLNLLAVGAAINESKGAGDAATWLPPVKSYRCTYVARQVAVKRKYGAWVTPAEHAAMSRILASCPTTPLPTAAPIPLGGAPIAAVPQPPEARVTPTPTPKATTTSPPSTTETGVHPGAFCSPEGALGYTKKGTPMACTFKVGDTRARWRSR